jgi:hypothetical protein
VCVCVFVCVCVVCVCVYVCVCVCACVWVCSVTPGHGHTHIQNPGQRRTRHVRHTHTHTHTHRNTTEGAVSKKWVGRGEKNCSDGEISEVDDDAFFYCAHKTEARTHLTPAHTTRPRNAATLYNTPPTRAHAHTNTCA